MAFTSCKHCNATNPESSRFCSVCGEPLPVSSSASVRASDSSSLSGTRTSHPGAALSAAEEAGRPFGPRYRLLSRLGKGGMGEVWKARDLELHQLVALKTIRPELLEDADLVDRFRHEITLARKVTHKNVCRIYDLGEVEGTRFISMEYLEGRNLKAFLDEEGPLPEEKAIPILRGICEGLKAAHEAGVVHRDLKPQNILIDHDGVPHLMDFGIAFSGETAGITRTGALIGTPEYMSPEQVRGERLDVRSDIYSLGLIVYEMVTQDLPFTADSAASSMYKRLSEKPRKPREIRKEVPPFLEKIILRCLEKERAFRYAGVEEILSDLQARHAPGITREYLAASVRQRRGALLAAGLGMAALAVVGILFSRGTLRVGGGAPPASAGPVVSLAVLPFQNLTGDSKSEWLRAGLANLLTTDLAQAPGIRVVSTARLSQILNDLHLADSKQFDAGTLQKVAEFVDARMVITGSFASMGSTLRVDTEVFQVTGEEMRAASTFKATSGSDREFLGMVDGLARQIRESMGATPEEIQAEHPKEIAQVISSSIPALKEYTAATEQLHRGGYLEAVEGFKRAVALDASFALAHARLGEAYRALGREPEALASLDAAAAQQDRASEREALVIRALQASLKHDVDGAIKSYEELVKRYPNDPESYFSLAGTYEQADEYEKAVTNYSKAIDGDEKYAAAYYGLGRAHFRLGDYEAALRNFNLALGLQDQVDNEEGKATALNGLGAVYYQMGRDEEAIRHYRESAEIKKRVGDLRGFALSMNNIAQSYRRSGDYQGALQAAEQAVETGRSMGDRKYECLYLESLGSIYFAAGRLAESLKTHQESLRIAREINDRRLAAANLANIGAIHAAQGRYADAEVYSRQALEERRAIEDQDGILRSLVDLGILQFTEGAADQAMASYLEAMKIARQAEDTDALPTISLNLAELYMERGQYRAASDSLKEALRLLTDSGDPSDLAAAHKFSADLAGRLGRFPEAESGIGEAVKIAGELKNQRLMAEVLTVRGRLRLRQRRGSEAGADFRRALEETGKIEDPVLKLQARLGAGLSRTMAGDAGGRAEIDRLAGEAEVLGNIPLVLRAQSDLARSAFALRRYAEADAAATRVLDRGGAFDSSEVVFQAHQVRGLCALAASRKDEAGRHLSAAVSILEKLARELPNGAAPGFFGRPDLKADLQEISRGLKQAGREDEAAKVSAWIP